MAELIEQILTLPKSLRLKIAMQILLSIQEEEKNADAWHSVELEKFQEALQAGSVEYLSEEDFWEAARKRVL